MSENVIPPAPAPETVPAAAPAGTGGPATMRALEGLALKVGELEKVCGMLHDRVVALESAQAAPVVEKKARGWKER